VRGLLPTDLTVPNLGGSAMTRVRLVRADWDARESIDTIQLQLLQLVEFINRFRTFCEVSWLK
jgi:hypothetical protein